MKWTHNYKTLTKVNIQMTVLINFQHFFFFLLTDSATAQLQQNVFSGQFDWGSHADIRAGLRESAI